MVNPEKNSTESLVIEKDNNSNFYKAVIETSGNKRELSFFAFNRTAFEELITS